MGEHKKFSGSFQELDDSESAAYVFVRETTNQTLKLQFCFLFKCVVHTFCRLQT